MDALRLLIADESAVARERLVDLLTDLDGIAVIGEAHDAPTARDLAHKLKPDVAILDLRMPRGSEEEVLRDMKQLDPAPLVIMLSNDAFPENRRRWLAKGVDYFFDKSTELEDVVSVLRGLLLAAARA